MNHQSFPNRSQEQFNLPAENCNFAFFDDWQNVYDEWLYEPQSTLANDVEHSLFFEHAQSMASQFAGPVANDQNGFAQSSARIDQDKVEPSTSTMDSSWTTEKERDPIEIVNVVSKRLS
ncbi:hypothetical protein M409DRAFT_16326 [Zasmidium cellare ATCC 36951]|uniref:Uncharacterized protein n=1 Tax=Zasmidium cellare ATCC 36951 TaxID=1080233 RepID=A0A6A6D3R0_ZASCE|nr:uncharacterized protein M409DRAFT_16326 [Zasmidium cellare ATCC 36951]KAF2174051.1 hypothetical protein M409DRAFT_16326 [Zasmidium cellare ATCC 36951]